MTGTAFARSVLTLPKAHLHLHFTGSMRIETVRELAAKHDLRLPNALTQEYPPRLAGSDERGWFRFQRLYDAARAVVRDESDMRRVVREAVEDDAAEGSRWLEIQVDPTSYAGFVGGITPMLEIVLDEAEKAAADEGIGTGVVVAASRIRHPFDARALARLAAKHSGKVVGFGLSNDERRGVTADFAPAFRVAHEAGLASVPHAGELLGAQAVSDTIDSLGPQRLGHGVRAAESDAVLQRVLDTDIALEVCPGSNIALGVYPSAEHVPLRKLFDAGATIALGADDPLLFGNRLAAQYDTAREVHGFSDEELAQLARQSVRASLAPDEMKRQMFADVDAWLESDPVVDLPR